MKLIAPFTVVDEVEQKGLLYVPESTKAANKPIPSTGIVIALGVELQADPIANMFRNEDGTVRRIIDVGTAVMFSRFAGSDVTIEQEDFRIMEFKEIMCTLELVDPVALVSAVGSAEQSAQ